MNNYFLMILLVMGLSVIMFFLMIFLSVKSEKDLEKMIPFECGFLGYEESRSPFSIHFFIVGLIFLIFDIELILMFPYVMNFCLGGGIKGSCSENSHIYFCVKGWFIFWMGKVSSGLTSLN